MKRCLLLSSLIFSASLSTFAQISKGSFLTGGSISLQSKKREAPFGESKDLVLQVQPSVGYFVMTKLATGIRTGYISSKYRNEDGEIWKYHTYSLAPFVRYYFLPRAGNVNVFIDGSYQLSKTRYAVNSSVSKTYAGYSLAAGPAIFLNGKVALEFTVGYTYSQSEFQEKEHTIGSAIGLQIHLGKGMHR